MNRKLYIYICIIIVFISCCSKTQEGPQIIRKRFVLNAGDTLVASLKQSGIPQASRFEIVNSLKNVFNPRRCQPGDAYEIEIDTSNKWINF